MDTVDVFLFQRVAEFSGHLVNSSVELVAPQPRTVRKPLDMQENQLVISFNTVLTQMELYFVTSRPPTSCAPCTHLNRASLTRPTPPILSPPGSHQPFIAASLESPLSPPVTMSNPAPSVMLLLCQKTAPSL